jgi:DNA-binding IclR family transcriptional regulator
VIVGGQCLVCVDEGEYSLHVRDVADKVGITERAAQRIVTDLVEAGYVRRTRVGRRNRYAINPTAEMRHEAQGGRPIGSLLELLELDTPPDTARQANNTT